MPASNTEQQPQGTCLICGRPGADTVGVVRAGSVMRCRHCGFGWANRADAPTFDESFYDEAFYDQFDDPDMHASRHTTFLRHLEGLETFRPAGRRLLDVGAARGDFVRLAQARGWDATGLEPSNEGVRRAAAQGTVLLPVTIESDQLPPASFDVVHLSHVLEHVPDPRRFLERCHELLVPGGILAIEVPNELENLFTRFRSWIGRVPPGGWLTAEHLWFFNPSTLEEIVRSSGFRIRHVRHRNYTTIQSRLPFGSLVKRLLDASGRLSGRAELIELYAERTD